MHFTDPLLMLSFLWNLEPVDPLPPFLSHLPSYPNLSTLHLSSLTLHPTTIPLFRSFLPNLLILSLAHCSFPDPSTLPALLSLLSTSPSLAHLSLSHSEGSGGEVLHALLPLLGTLKSLDLRGMQPSVVPTRAAFHLLVEGVAGAANRGGGKGTLKWIGLGREDRAREDDLWEGLRGVVSGNRRRGREGGW